MNNPVLTQDFKKLRGLGATVEGVAWKTTFYITFALLSALCSWQHAEFFMGYIKVIPFAALAVGMAFTYLPDYAMVLAPIYSVVQGFLIGVCSYAMEMVYPGVVFEAISCTFGIALSCAFLYANGLVKVTSTFKKITIILTFGVMIMYIIDLIAGVFFNTFVPFLHENTVPGMITSVIIVFIATANLFLDFARIEEAVNKHIDEKYECYLAFGLTVTLIWLYLEILRLLGKSRSRE